MSQKNILMLNLGLLWLRFFLGGGFVYHSLSLILSSDIDQLIFRLEMVSVPTPHIYVWVFVILELIGGGLVLSGMATRIGAGILFLVTGIEGLFLLELIPSFAQLAGLCWVISGALILTDGGKFGVDTRMKRTQIKENL